MSLEDSDTMELIDRYTFLIRQYVTLTSELAGRLEKFGKYRKELQLLSAEFVRRGVKVEDNDSLVKFVEEEMAKRKEDVETTDPGS